MGTGSGQLQQNMGKNGGRPVPVPIFAHALGICEKEAIHDSRSLLPMFLRQRQEVQVVLSTHSRSDRQAFQLDMDGQHEVALRSLDEVVKENPANPEAWGRMAQLLFNNNRVEDAENALQKAFDITPNYPFGHYLRALFRYYEGEIEGALLLFRKAAELYDPEGPRRARQPLRDH